MHRAQTRICFLLAFSLLAACGGDGPSEPSNSTARVEVTEVVQGSTEGSPEFRFRLENQGGRTADLVVVFAEVFRGDTVFDDTQASATNIAAGETRVVNSDAVVGFESHANNRCYRVAVQTFDGQRGMVAQRRYEPVCP